MTSEYPKAVFVILWTWLCKTVQRKYWWWETHWIPFRSFPTLFSFLENEEICSKEWDSVLTLLELHCVLCVQRGRLPKRHLSNRFCRITNLCWKLCFLLMLVIFMHNARNCRFRLQAEGASSQKTWKPWKSLLVTIWMPQGCLIS